MNNYAYNNTDNLQCFPKSYFDETYYYNSTLNSYSKCYYTCNECYDIGNSIYHNCKTCNKAYSLSQLKTNINNSTNRR